MLTLKFHQMPPSQGKVKIQNSERIQYAPTHLLSLLNFSSLYLLYFRTPCLLFDLPLPEGRAGTAWEPSEPWIFLFSPIKCSVSHYSQLSPFSVIHELRLQRVKDKTLASYALSIGRQIMVKKHHQMIIFRLQRIWKGIQYSDKTQNHTECLTTETWV
jgi:hypothetical protein